MGRPSNKEERRLQIVSALLTVMSDKGYDGATIKDIANQAGLAPGLIHHHFKSKQQILLALVEQVIAVGQTRYETLESAANTPYEQLNAFVHAHLGLGDGADIEAVKAWVLIGSEAVKQHDVCELYKQAIEQRQNLLVNLLMKASNKALTKKPASLVAATVLSAIEGAYLLGVTCSDVMPKNYASVSVMNIIDHALEG